MPRPALKPSTQIKYYPLNGGLDVVTPALSVDPGFALAMVNYEPWFNGGYRRLDGYERYDGRAKPSLGTAYGVQISSTAGLPTTIGTGTSSGNTGTGLPGTGVTSGATGQFVESITVFVNGVGTNWLAITNVTGTFTAGEKVQIGTSTSTGVLLAAPSIGFAPAGTGTSGFPYASEFLAQAQNYYRGQIQPVPGVGNVLGVWQNGTNIYAVRGTNTSGTSTSALPALLWKSSGAGWAVAGTYVTTLHYQNAVPAIAQGTGTVNTNGVITISAMATGTFAQGMLVSDVTGYIPLGATVTRIISGTGGIGQMQLSAAPSMAVPVEQIYGISTAATLPAVGANVTGASGTGTVYLTIPQDTASGYVALTNVTGTFTANEALKTGGVLFGTATSTQSLFALPAGGFYRFENKNYFASASSYYTYAVNGSGPAFQIDNNDVILPILMPLSSLPNQPATNNPFLLRGYQGFLFLAFPNGIAQQSVQGVPYQFDGFLGAAEFGAGSEITGLWSMVGPNLIINTAQNTQAISGNSDATFVQNVIAEKAGAIKNASVLLDTVYALNNLGITSLSRTQSYGNFVGSTVSQLVMPMVQALRSLFADATIVRTSNQARFYFTDGSVLIMYVPGLGQQNKAWSAIESGVTAQFGYANYPAPVFNICNSEDQNNNEVGYFGSSNGDGYVYQDRSGTSWDGAVVTSYIRLAFNNVGSPATRKYFRRADLELNSAAQINLSFAWDLDYSASSASSAVLNLTASNVPVLNVFGGGGYWDSITWNQFEWDGQTISTARASLNGTGENVSFLIFHQAITDTPFILQGLTLYFDPRRLQR